MPIEREREKHEKQNYYKSGVCIVVICQDDMETGVDHWLMGKLLMMGQRDEFDQFCMRTTRWPSEFEMSNFWVPVPPI